MSTPMRMSELSEAADVPIPTIKYYLREGLLHRGASTAVNQAVYGDDHVRRLRLIRVLRDVGGLGIDDIRAVVRALEDESLPVHEVLGVAQYALGPAPDDEPGPVEARDALAEVDDFIRRRRWRVGAGSPSRRMLADALTSLRRLGQDASTALFDPYADLADGLAQWELDFIPKRGSRSTVVEASIVGTVVFESVLVALRRLTQEHHSARRFARRAKR